MMEAPDDIKDIAQALGNALPLRSLPVAVKLIRRGEEVPVGAGRPLRDLGGRITPCVGWHLARHLGLSVGMLEEDFSSECPASLFIFGIIEPLAAWVEGELAHEVYAATPQAGRTMEAHVPRLPTGEYLGIALAPLEKATFAPDAVMIYCNSSDAMRLVTASAWETGEPLEMSVAGRALCGDGVVQAILRGRPVVAIPCGGDRFHGRTQDDEVVFVAPACALRRICGGLEGYQRSHGVDSLGGQSMLSRKYAKMAAALEELRTAR